MSLRQASNKIRKILTQSPCKVRGKTISFEGFGYGSAGFIDIECGAILSETTISELRKISTEIQKDGKFIVSLCGNAYPFGQKI